YLYAVLRSAEGHRGWGAAVVLVVGVLHAATRFDLLGAELGTRAAPSSAADTLEPLGEYGFLVTTLLFGLFILCVAATGTAQHVFPHWFGWIGVIAGASNVVVNTAATLEPGWLI